MCIYFQWCHSVLCVETIWLSHLTIIDENVSFSRVKHGWICNVPWNREMEPLVINMAANKLVVSEKIGFVLVIITNWKRNWLYGFNSHGFIRFLMSKYKIIKCFVFNWRKNIKKLLLNLFNFTNIRIIITRINWTMF